MTRNAVSLAALAATLALAPGAQGFPFIWSPYLRYLNTQVQEVSVADGETYWRVAEGYVIPPPDEGYGDIKIWFQTIDENGNPLGGVPVRVYATYGGGTLLNSSTPGEFIMGGGNWLDFYNQIGPYALEINDGLPSERCVGLGLPGNQHFSYTIVFQRAVKGTTPTASPPTPLGQPAGTNLLTNPGAETGDLTGWASSHITLDSDIFQNVGNRAGSHRFNFATSGPASGWMAQTVAVTPGRLYTFGFWVAKKSDNAALTLQALWGDNAGQGGTLYTMGAGETIFPIYGTRQDAVFQPIGDQIDVGMSMAYGSDDFAAFHIDEVWLIEVTPTAPIIFRTPATIQADVIVGLDAPSDTFTVANTGIGTLTYTVTDNVGWLSADPATGDAADETDTITLSYATAGLSTGEYQGIVTVSDPAAMNNPRTLVVDLDVHEPPTISVDPSAVAAKAVVGTNPPAASLAIGNAGGGTLHYSIAAPAAWLTPETEQGTATTETDTVRLFFDTTGLGAGTYNTTVTITDPDATNSPVSVPVELQLVAQSDFDQDGDVDLTDYAFFLSCYNGPSGPITPICSAADIDDDLDVDLSDYGAFLGCYNGPARPPACD